MLKRDSKETVNTEAKSSDPIIVKEVSRRHKNEDSNIFL
jgi:hypothetical protein